MFLNILLFIAGLALVVLGADWLVSGASKLAYRLRVSELVIGLVIVAFGTSMPELVVSASASLKGSNDIAIANVVGSNLFNLLFILGIAGLIYPMAVNRSIVRMDLPVSFLGALLLLGVGLFPRFVSGDGQISWWEGVIMLAVFALYMAYVMHMAMKNRKETVRTDAQQVNIWWAIMLILVGLGGLVGGGNLLVDSAISLAREWGMSEKFIGMTIVAMGTSLPELATSVTAAVRKKNDIAIANVVGSNIFNILFIIPVCSFIGSVTYSTRFNFDLLFLMGATVLYWLFVARKRMQFRLCSIVLVALYILFTVYMVQME